MIRKSLCGFLLGLGLASGQSLPEGKGRSEFQRICGKCHGVQLATNVHQSAPQWSATVDEMVGRGAEGTDDEFELIVKYLAANFGPDKGDSDSKPSATKKININTATAAELTDVLELSQRDASAIVQHRTEKGDFKDWSDLRKVPDIDLKRLQEQKERIVFTPVRNAAGNQK